MSPRISVKPPDSFHLPLEWVNGRDQERDRREIDFLCASVGSALKTLLTCCAAAWARVVWSTAVRFPSLLAKAVVNARSRSLELPGCPMGIRARSTMRFLGQPSAGFPPREATRDPAPSSLWRRAEERAMCRPQIVLTRGRTHCCVPVMHWYERLDFYSRAHASLRLTSETREY
jgi:hypothetical protein